MAINKKEQKDTNNNTSQDNVQVTKYHFMKLLFGYLYVCTGLQFKIYFFVWEEVSKFESHCSTLISPHTSLLSLFQLPK